MPLLGIIVTCIFIENMVLSQFLGVCPFITESKKKETAVGLGLVTVFILTVTTLVAWLIYHGILVFFRITFLKTPVFVLVSVILVQGVGKIISIAAPALYAAVGKYFPLVTGNCAVFGIVLYAVFKKEYGLITSVTTGFAAGVGFLLSLILFSFLQERIETEYIPAPFRGVPVVLITAGLMSLAFMAFDKALLANLHLLP